VALQARAAAEAIEDERRRNMMTEREARERWCPMVRMVHEAEDEGSSYNRLKDRESTYSNPLGCNCIASNCMMWRWNSAKTAGYCGLGGK
jgi:hypothetical protein